MKRYLNSLVVSVSGVEQVEHLLTDNTEDITRIILERNWSAEDLLVVNGGDGTAQHVFTACLNLDMDIVPTFALLPGGTTNMTANDYNSSRRYSTALGTLRDHLIGTRPLPPVSKRLLVVESPDNNKKNYGAFFGTGLIIQGIQYCDDYIYRTGMRSEIGAGIAVARAAWGIARKQPPFAKVVTVAIDDYPAMPMLFLMTTSLDRLFLGMTPFWGVGNGELRSTRIMQGATKFLRNLPNVIRGGASAAGLTRVGGYESEILKGMTLSFDGPYTIDGEIYDSHDEELVISTSRAIDVLSL